MSENQLFSDFSPADAKSWKQKIQVDLKGADYNDTLVWESPEGIKVKPFYNSEDVESFEHNLDESASKWRIGQLIRVNDEVTVLNKCKEAIENGVESLILRVESDQINPASLLDDAAIANLNIFLDLRAMNAEMVEIWIDNLPDSTEGINIIWDPINRLAATGNWYTNRETDIQEFKELYKKSGQAGMLSIDISLYQNAGANRIQQLAYALAHAKEHLDSISENGIPSITFLTSVDTNYFFEIAKLRALRLLWSRLSEQFGETTTCQILAFPTRRNKTLYDYNVNMLRTTTECMAAILGGADTVYNLPYDDIYHEENSFAERISRNQLLILKNESYFDKVVNAASGAYYIEKLTEEMMQKAWDLYQQILDGGGWLTQLKEHKIQKKIKESASKQQDAFDKGQEVLVGSNKYPNEAEQMKDQLQRDPFLKKENRKTLIEPILEHRLAEKLEQNRLDNE